MDLHDCIGSLFTLGTVYIDKLVGSLHFGYLNFDRAFNI